MLRSLSAVLLFVLAFLPAFPSAAAEEETYDVVVYGGTSGGVAAAVQVRKLGRTVVLIEPSKHLGGLTTGGLGATDIGNKGAIGGLSREFYRAVKKHYDDPAAWRFIQREEYRSGRASESGTEDAMWTFEPHVAEKIMNAWTEGMGVKVVRGQRLDLKNGVRKKDGRIEALVLESGRVFRGAMFIDAGYEGDLMAVAGVSYHVGREANAAFDETLNGVQTRNATKHQFIRPVDPYVRPGDKASGVLFGIDPNGPGEEGAGDHRVQAYNFRLCATNVPENRLPWPKPADYDPAKYELLLRNFEAGDHRIPWNPVMMPNRKTDANNNFAVSTDYIGQNYGYPDGDYAARERIVADHLSYTQGLLWTLANHERVPEKVRAYYQQWGPSKDEFADNNHWPHQIYVREARRMVSAYVMTQHNCQGRKVAEDPVGLAAYTMDSHNTQRHIDAEGHVRNEGDVQVGGFPPYPISYRSIVPREEQCQNLFVPVCLSATHIAFGSIRMEPVFMALGQSAATAAVQAIDEGKPVQRIDYAKLRARLEADGQVLTWKSAASTGGPPINPADLKGVVIDESSADRSGDWIPSTSIGGYVGTKYFHDDNTGKGEKTINYVARLPRTGPYSVRVSYTPNENRATNVPIVVHHADGKTKVTINQRKKPEIDGAFVNLGTFRFVADTDAKVVISTETTDGHVIADAVQFVSIEMDDR
jgi:hypothetical protein